MTTGIVKWFNARKGYGFITPDEGEGDVFVHYTGIIGEENSFKSLYEGDKVNFNIVDGEKGKEAHEVEITERAPRKFRSRGPISDDAE